MRFCLRHSFTVSLLQMPYEDVLPYHDFAVHIREHALYRLPEVLDAIVSTKGLVRSTRCHMHQFSVEWTAAFLTHSSRSISMGSKFPCMIGMHFRIEKELEPTKADSMLLTLLS